MGSSLARSARRRAFSSGDRSIFREMRRMFMTSSYDVNQILSTQSCEQRSKLRQLVMGVQSARIRQDADPRGGDTLSLESEASLALTERDSKGGDTQKRDNLRLILANFSFQPAGTGKQFRSRKFVGRRRGPVDDIGDAKSEVQEFPILECRQKPRREPSSVEGRPKAVARPSEMMADGTRIQTRIDTAKENPKPGRDHVSQPLSSSGGDLFLGGFPNLSHFSTTAPLS